MSILGGVGQIVFSPEVIVLVAVLAMAAPLAAKLGLFRPSAVVGPRRLEPDESALPLGIAMMMAICTLFLVSSGYSLWRDRAAAAGPATMPAETGAVGSAFLYSVPPLCGAIVMLLVDWRMGGAALLRRLGLSLRRIPSGLFTGGLAAVVILPATYAIVIFEEPIYRRMNFTHPQEHDILKLVGQSPDHPIARAILMISAIFIAPVAEEIFFRGHLQTFLQRLLIAISRPDQLGHAPGVQGFSVIQNGELPVSTTPPTVGAAAPPAAEVVKPDGQREKVLDYAAAPFATVVFKPVWQTWAAILVTSAVFASAHPRWMWPAIFFLAVGLGYCYERTGNLWANITIHSLFNALSTAVFLFQPHS